MLVLERVCIKKCVFEQRYNVYSMQRLKIHSVAIIRYIYIH